MNMVPIGILGKRNPAAKKKQNGASGGAAAVVDEEPINGYPTPETLQSLTLEFLEREKATLKAKGKKLMIPILPKDKENIYGKLASKCQEYIEDKLGKQAGDLGLSLDYMQTLLEQYHSGDMQYYKDKDGTEYKDPSDAPCWFCRLNCCLTPQFFCDHEKKGPGYNIPCDKICCLKCSPQGENFNVETDDFFCLEHNNDQAKKQHEEATKKKILVNPLLSVYDMVKTETKKIELDVFHQVTGDRNLTQKRMRVLFNLKPSETPSAAMYRMAAIATAAEGEVPKIIPLSKQQVKVPPTPKVKLEFLPEFNKHFWYKEFNGLEISRTKFLELLTDKKTELKDDFEEFGKLKKKAPAVVTNEKDKKRMLELNLKRAEVAEECDFVVDLLRIGKLFIEQKEWKAVMNDIRTIWTALELHIIRAPVAYDEEVPDEEMLKFAMAEVDDD